MIIEENHWCPHCGSNKMKRTEVVPEKARNNPYAFEFKLADYTPLECFAQYTCNNCGYKHRYYALKNSEQFGVLPSHSEHFPDGKVRWY